MDGCGERGYLICCWTQNSVHVLNVEMVFILQTSYPKTTPRLVSAILGMMAGMPLAKRTAADATRSSPVWSTCRREGEPPRRGGFKRENKHQEITVRLCMCRISIVTKNQFTHLPRPSVPIERRSRGKEADLPKTPSLASIVDVVGGGIRNGVVC